MSGKTTGLVSPDSDELVGFEYRQQQPPDVDNVHVNGYEHDAWSMSGKTTDLVSPDSDELVGFDYRQQQPPDLDNVHVDGYEHDASGLGGTADFNEPPLVFAAR